MHIAVTGGCGFIGSHVVDHLVRAGHEVAALDPRGRWQNPAAQYRLADIFAERELAATVAGADAVFHLARAADVNVVAADPVAATRLNVEGTARVIEAARQASVGWLVLASTVWVYDAAVGHGELTEHAPVDLRSPGHVYVATKLSAELIVHSYREMYGQHFTILGYGIPYGPRMRDALVVARFVRAAMEVVAARQPRVRAFGFTDRIPHLMSAADLVITSSGDTCSEARTVGRPLLLIDVVQGHGRDNLQHELELGDAMVTSAGAADVTRCALAALDRAEPAPPGPARFQSSWESPFNAALSSCGL